MTIPPLLVYLAGIALVLFIGGTLASLHSLRRRVKALEESNQRRAEREEVMVDYMMQVRERLHIE